MCVCVCVCVCVCARACELVRMYVHTHTHTHIYMRERFGWMDWMDWIGLDWIHIYIHISVAEWLAWLTSNCGRIGAIGSSPCNGLKPNL